MSILDVNDCLLLTESNILLKESLISDINCWNRISSSSFRLIRFSTPSCTSFVTVVSAFSSSKSSIARRLLVKSPAMHDHVVVYYKL